MQSIFEKIGLRQVGLQREMQTTTPPQPTAKGIIEGVLKTSTVFTTVNASNISTNNQNLVASDLALLAESLANKYDNNMGVEQFFSKNSTDEDKALYTHLRILSALGNAGVQAVSFQGKKYTKKSDYLRGVLGITDGDILARFDNYDLSNLTTGDFTQEVNSLKNNPLFATPQPATPQPAPQPTPAPTTDKPNWLEWIMKLFEAIFSGDFSKVFSGWGNAKDDSGTALPEEEKKATKAYYETATGKTELQTTLGVPDQNEIREAVLQSKSPEEFFKNIGTKKGWADKPIQIYTKKDFSIKASDLANGAGWQQDGLTFRIANNKLTIVNTSDDRPITDTYEYKLVGDSYKVEIYSKSGKTVKASNLGLATPQELLGISKTLEFDHDGNAATPNRTIDLSKPENYEAARREAILAEIKKGNSNLLSPKTFDELIIQNKSAIAELVGQDLVTAWANDPANLEALRSPNPTFAGLNANALDPKKKADLVKETIAFKITVNGEETTVALTLDEIAAEVGNNKKPEDYISSDVIQKDFDVLSNEDKKYKLLTTPSTEVNELNDAYDFIRASFSPVSNAHEALLAIGLTTDQMRKFSGNLLEQMRAGLDLSKITIDNADLKYLLREWNNKTLTDSDKVNKATDIKNKGLKDSPISAVFSGLKLFQNPNKTFLGNDLSGIDFYNNIISAYSSTKNKDVETKLKSQSGGDLPTYTYAEHLENISAVKNILAKLVGNNPTLHHSAAEKAFANPYQKYIFNTLVQQAKEDEMVSAGVYERNDIQNRTKRRGGRTELEYLMDRAVLLESRAKDRMPSYNNVGDPVKENLVTPENMYVKPELVAEMRNNYQSGYVRRNDGIVNGINKPLNALGFLPEDIRDAKNAIRDRVKQAEKDAKKLDIEKEKRQTGAKNTEDLLLGERLMGIKVGNAYPVKDAYNSFQASLKDNGANNEKTQAAYNKLVEEINTNLPENFDVDEKKRILSSLEKLYTDAGGVLFKAGSSEENLLSEVRGILKNNDIDGRYQAETGALGDIKTSTSTLDKSEELEVNTLTDKANELDNDGNLKLTDKEKARQEALIKIKSDLYSKYPKETADYLFDSSDNTELSENDDVPVIPESEEELNKKLEIAQAKKDYAEKNYTDEQIDQLIEIEFEKKINGTDLSGTDYNGDGVVNGSDIDRYIADKMVQFNTQNDGKSITGNVQKYQTEISEIEEQLEDKADIYSYRYKYQLKKEIKIAAEKEDYAKKGFTEEQIENLISIKYKYEGTGFNDENVTLTNRVDANNLAIRLENKYKIEYDTAKKREESAEEKGQVSDPTLEAEVSARVKKYSQEHTNLENQLKLVESGISDREKYAEMGLNPEQIKKALEIEAKEITAQYTEQDKKIELDDHILTSQLNYIHPDKKGVDDHIIEDITLRKMKANINETIGKKEQAILGKVDELEDYMKKMAGNQDINDPQVQKYLREMLALINSANMALGGGNSYFYNAGEKLKEKLPSK